MVVVVEIATKRVLTSSSCNTLDLELANAMNAGFTADELDAKEVTDEEFQVILNAQTRPVPPPSDGERISALEDFMMTLL